MNVPSSESNNLPCNLLHGDLATIEICCIRGCGDYCDILWPLYDGTYKGNGFTVIRGAFDDVAVGGVPIYFDFMDVLDYDRISEDTEHIGFTHFHVGGHVGDPLVCPGAERRYSILMTVLSLRVPAALKLSIREWLRLPTVGQLKMYGRGKGARRRPFRDCVRHDLQLCANRIPYVSATL